MAQVWLLYSKKIFFAHPLKTFRSVGIFHMKEKGYGVFMSET